MTRSSKDKRIYSHNWNTKNRQISQDFYNYINRWKLFEKSIIKQLDKLLKESKLHDILYFWGNEGTIAKRI